MKFSTASSSFHSILIQVSSCNFSAQREAGVDFMHRRYILEAGSLVCYHDENVILFIRFKSQGVLEHEIGKRDVLSRGLQVAFCLPNLMTFTCRDVSIVFMERGFKVMKSPTI